MDNFIEILKITVWPATTIILAVIFRRIIIRTLLRLSSVTVKEFRAEFKNEIDRIKADIDISTTQDNNQTDEKNLTNGSYKAFNSIERISTSSPRSAILEAWWAIESLINETAKEHSIQPHDLSIGEKILKLSEERVIPEVSIVVFERMTSIRNRIVHLSDEILTKSDADEYVKLAKKLFLVLTPRGPGHLHSEE